MDCAEWSMAIHVAVEEEELANTAPEKFSCFRRLLVGYMAKRDYVRASMVAENVRNLFPIEAHSDKMNEASFFCELFDKRHQEEVIFLLTILSIVCDDVCEYVRSLHAYHGRLVLFANSTDSDAYNFIFSIFINKQIPEKRAYFGDIFSIFSDSYGLEEFVRIDPWLSRVPQFGQRLLSSLRALLRLRLSNISCCSNDIVKGQLEKILNNE
jgi:hypothetical protein